MKTIPFSKLTFFLQFLLQPQITTSETPLSNQPLSLCQAILVFCPKQYHPDDETQYDHRDFTYNEGGWLAMDYMNKVFFYVLIKF